MILIIMGEPLGGKGLTGPICPSLFLNLFSLIPGKTIPIEGEPLGGEKVNESTAIPTTFALDRVMATG